MKKNSKEEEENAAARAKANRNKSPRKRGLVSFWLANKLKNTRDKERETNKADHWSKLKERFREREEYIGEPNQKVSAAKRKTNLKGSQ